LEHFQIATVAAGLGKQKFHSLRHTFNTRAGLCLPKEMQRAVSSHESEEAGTGYEHFNSMEGAQLILREVGPKFDEMLARQGWNDAEFTPDFLIAPNGNGIGAGQVQ